MSAMLGAYLGETLLRSGLRELGFSWVKDEDGSVAVGKDGDMVFPLSKAYKRITAGPGDDLLMFSMVSLAMLTDGKLNISA